MNDIADNRSIAVLRSRLPYTDRRSLSQAWFSALHLAADGANFARVARRSGDLTDRGPSRRAQSDVARENARGPSPKTTGGASPSRTSREGTDSVLKRVRELPKPVRAAAFARARSYPPFSTSLTIGVDGARIKLLLRREGATLHVVALCAERNAELVRRALACADAHLRRNGESVRASVLTRAEDAE